MIPLAEHQEAYTKLLSDHQRRRGQADMLAQTQLVMATKQAALAAKLAIESETARLLQLTSMETWTQAKTLIEELVTRALRAIFTDRDYKFIIRQEVKRGVSAVDFAVMDNGMELNLTDEVGGGIVDVVSLVLRISFLVLYRPKMRQFLVLDEPTAHVGATYQGNVGKFLKQLTNEMGIQILLTTHSQELSAGADQVFHATNADGVCIIEEETTK
jgi:ABC-type glutathione transport system ATPase component